EAELAERRHLDAGAPLDARAHRRTEPVDVEADLRPPDRHARRGAAPEDRAQRLRRLDVEVGEPDPELAPLPGRLRPLHLGDGEDALPVAGVEATRERLPDLRQVRGAEP